MIEIAIFPAAMPSAMIRLFSIMTPTGCRVVLPVPATMVFQ